MKVKNILIKITKFSANLISKSYYLTQVARWVVQIYDNDQNADMQINGEIKLQSLMSSRTGANGVIVDVGANVGDWSVALVGGATKVAS
jgi:hypothetical protein